MIRVQRPNSTSPMCESMTGVVDEADQREEELAGEHGQRVDHDALARGTPPRAAAGRRAVGRGFVRHVHKCSRRPRSADDRGASRRRGAPAACDDGAVGAAPRRRREPRVACSPRTVASTRALRDDGVAVELVVPLPVAQRVRAGRLRRSRRRAARRATSTPGASSGEGRPQRHGYLVRATVACCASSPPRAPDRRGAVLARRACSGAVPRGARGSPTGSRSPRPSTDRCRGASRASRAGVLARAAFVARALPERRRRSRSAWGATVEPDVVAHDVAAHAARRAADGRVHRRLRRPARGGEGRRRTCSTPCAPRRTARSSSRGPDRWRARVAAAGPHVDVPRPGRPRRRRRRLRAGPRDLRARAARRRRGRSSSGAWSSSRSSAAVPVVATATGELPWVLSTTGGGVLVAERDVAALAAALASLRDDPAGAAALGAAGATRRARALRDAGRRGAARRGARSRQRSLTSARTRSANRALEKLAACATSAASTPAGRRRPASTARRTRAGLTSSSRMPGHAVVRSCRASPPKRRATVGVPNDGRLERREPEVLEADRRRGPTACA